MLAPLGHCLLSEEETVLCRPESIVPDGGAIAGSLINAKLSSNSKDHTRGTQSLFSTHSLPQAGGVQKSAPCLEPRHWLGKPSSPDRCLPLAGG